MSFFALLAEALRSLTKNKIRTALSMLGIVIGVGAVITLVAMAQATKTRVEQEIARMGDDWMFIGTWGLPRGGVRKADVARRPNQSRDDALAIMRECPAVRAATPSNRMQLQVKSSYSNYSTGVQGAFPNFHDIRRWNVVSGRKLDDTDEAAKRPVCVIGQTAARELFGSVNPVGEEITVKSARFQVVGVLDYKGQANGRDNDDLIMFCYSVFQQKIAGTEISETILAAAQHNVPPKVAEDQIRRLLKQRHNIREGEPDDFRIFALSEPMAAREASSAEFEWLLRMIAGVSLVVGGIGIMNIMLVSVTERTREIGLRMAIGAGTGDVLLQFLIEAIALCTLGGIIGMFAGWLFCVVLTQTRGYETEFSYQVAGIALSFAFATGVFFGFYPAWRASRLDPIEALRFE